MTAPIDTTPAAPRRQGWAIATRALAALIGGLIFTNAGVALVSLLTADPATGFYWSAILSTAFWVIALLWSFATRAAWQAWVGLVAASATMLGLCFLLRMS